MMNQPTAKETRDILSGITIIAKMAPWLKALLFGAFVLGGWTGLLQFRVAGLEKREEINGVLLNAQAIRQSADHDEIIRLKALEESIDNSLKEIKADIKELRK